MGETVRETTSNCTFSHLTVIPWERRRAKSPTSWGSSWQRTATEVENPAARLNKKGKHQFSALKPKSNQPEGEGGANSESVGKIVNGVADDGPFDVLARVAQQADGRGHL